MRFFNNLYYLCERNRKQTNQQYLINMKKLMLLAIPAMLLASCGPEKYTISGKAGEDMEGKKVFLVNGEDAVDSCSIANGVFAFTGTVDGQAMYVLNVEEGTKFPVFVENGAQVSVDLNEAPVSVKDNGGLNDVYAGVMDKVGQAGKALNEKVSKLMAGGVQYTDVRDSVAADMEALMNIYHDGITENKDNYVGAIILSMVAEDFYPETPSLDSVMAEVKYAKDVKALQNLRASYESAEATKEGKMFVDFTGLSLDSSASKLSDYVGKGKYVLVDFWASWCGPCKAEIPNLIDLHNRFSGEKFTVLGVNVWDEESKFKAELTEKGIGYPQIFIPRDNADNATELYGIKGIPQIILFAPDGTIVKRNLRGEEMKTFVAEQLK